MLYTLRLSSLLLLCLLAGCGANYHLIEPETVVFDQYRDTLNGGEVEIAWRPNVLKEAGNQRYARREKRNGISLLAVQVVNRGPDTLWFADEIRVFSDDLAVYPLSLEETAGALGQLSDEEEEEGVVELDRGFARQLITVVGVLSDAKQVSADFRLATELFTCYLPGLGVPPGASVAGLLGLPVLPGTALRFERSAEPLREEMGVIVLDTLPPALPGSVPEREAALKDLGKSFFSKMDTLPGPEQNIARGGLADRKVLHREKIQDYSGKEGVIVLNVCVDQKGEVKYAYFSQKGSTTHDMDLIQLALDNIRQWVFSESTVEKQCGTVTYLFKLP